MFYSVPGVPRGKMGRFDAETPHRFSKKC